MKKSRQIRIYYCFLVCILFISCVKDSKDEMSTPKDDIATSNDIEITNALLNSFIDENGGQGTFSAEQLLALETLLQTQEDLEA
jgi:hypothetical protein